ncbi:MAG: hypothetical protein P8169_13020, partial [Chloroflexota bacterium]
VEDLLLLGVLKREWANIKINETPISHSKYVDILRLLPLSGDVFVSSPETEGIVENSHHGKLEIRIERKPL